jgi:hypothetical protein
LIYITIGRAKKTIKEEDDTNYVDTNPNNKIVVSNG